jgi:HPt (histidine-containing phosphotransfer) domain-containing protein
MMRAKKSPESIGPVSPEVLDPAGLQWLQATLRDQAAVMLPLLLDHFFQEAPRLLREARRASEHGQTADLFLAAHNLKANSTYFGAMALAAVARDLESLARGGVLDGAAALIERAEAEYAKAQVALEGVRR